LIKDKLIGGSVLIFFVKSFAHDLWFIFIFDEVQNLY